MSIIKYVVFFLMLLASMHVQAQSAETDMAFTDSHKPIFVSKKNPTFKIVLHANPTTGYSWFIKDYNTQFISAQSDTFIPPTQAIPGRGGTSVWTFQVNPTALHVPTLTTVTLVYTRPWSNEDGMEETFTIVTG